jgi:hypothetical protein
MLFDGHAGGFAPEKPAKNPVNSPSTVNHRRKRRCRRGLRHEPGIRRGDQQGLSRPKKAATSPGDRHAALDPEPRCHHHPARRHGRLTWRGAGPESPPPAWRRSAGPSAASGRCSSCSRCWNSRSRRDRPRLYFFLYSAGAVRCCGRRNRKTSVLATAITAITSCAPIASQVGLTPSCSSQWGIGAAV